MSITSSHDLPSNRRFGTTMSIALCVLSIYGAIRRWGWIECGWILGVSATIGAITLFAPSALAPLNRGWSTLGKLIGRVVSPIVLGVIFFGILTPVSLVTRLLGRDELRLRHPKKNTYWITRDCSETLANSFKNQF